MSRRPRSPPRTASPACGGCTNWSRAGSQFIVATHSPILLAYPGATIYECGADGLTPVDYDDAGPVRPTRGFLAAPERYLSLLFDD